MLSTGILIAVFAAVAGAGLYMAIRICQVGSRQRAGAAGRDKP